MMKLNAEILAFMGNSSCSFKGGNTMKKFLGMSSVVLVACDGVVYPSCGCGGQKTVLLSFTTGSIGAPFIRLAGGLQTY